VTEARPPSPFRLLDLFCCEGGAGKGYADAGFRVVGIDIEPQPRYPFEFIQADANDYPLDGFDAVHASPPCQDHSVSASLHAGAHGTDWMLDHTIARLRAAGLPYVVENVGGAVMPSALTLCGTVFDLGLHRHRRFETSFPLLAPPCNPAAIRYRGREAEVFGHHGNSDRIRAEWGVDWMDRDGIAQCIPPAMTEYLGAALLAELASLREAS
jgi:DNA (cytosine-5)-methyltransferase 1